MEGFSNQQLHQSSPLPYCFLSEPEPIPGGFPACSSLGATVGYEATTSSSLDTSSVSMVYSPVLLQLHESFPLEAADDKRRMASIKHAFDKFFPAFDSK